MKKIVVIGANDFQNQLILKAKARGFETHVFAWECGDVGEKTADHFYPISIVEKEAILEECRKIQPDGVVSIASDLASLTVNYVAEELGLTGNGMQSALISTNKHLMRHAFEENGLPSPKSIQVEADGEWDLSGFSWPVIVKPTDRSGSRGIFLIKSPDQLREAVQSACEESFEKKALIEEFAGGEEFSVEYVSFAGEHHFLTVTRKFTTGAPRFIEIGHLEPSGLSEEMIRRIQEIVPRALDALGIRYGASHSELKIDREGKIRLIEIGGRMGGDCIGSDLVYLSTGFDFVNAVIDIACGNPPSLAPTGPAGHAAVRFLFSQKDLENLEWVKKHHGDVIYRISDIERIDDRVIKDSSTRYGYYLMRSEDRSLIEEIMERINEEG